MELVTTKLPFGLFVLSLFTKLRMAALVYLTLFLEKHIQAMYDTFSKMKIENVLIDFFY